MTSHKRKVRAKRAARMYNILKEIYPEAKIALQYSSDFECLVAVQLSAQCTDERVNKVTKTLFKKYKTIGDYANASLKEMEQDVYQTGFYRNKAKNIIAAAKKINKDFNGELPRTLKDMVSIPGTGRKTANVVLASLYGIVEGIAVDTHVRRFAIRFDLSDFTDPIHIEKDLMEILPEEKWWGFNHRLVNYGRDYCKAHKHDCSKHPLTKIYPKANIVWPKAR